MSIKHAKDRRMDLRNRTVSHVAAALALALVTAPVTAVSVLAEQPKIAANSGPAQKAIDGQLNAFKAKDHASAFSFAAPTIKQMFGSSDRFIGMVKGGYAPIYGAQSWSFGRSREAGGAVNQEVLLVGPAGRDWVALYTLRQQPDGTWKIAGVQMKPAESRST